MIAAHFASRPELIVTAVVAVALGYGTRWVLEWFHRRRAGGP